MNGNVKSGPNPRSRSGAAEVREVQFEVKNNCPVSADEEWTCNPSFAVWVQYPAVEVSYAGQKCRGKRYRLTDQRKKQMRAMGFDGPAKFATVCEHMGRIIE